MERFDPPALHAALGARRRERDLARAAVARETGVSAATIARLRRPGRCEVDGVLALTRWLGRRIEDFTRHAER